MSIGTNGEPSRTDCALRDRTHPDGTDRDELTVEFNISNELVTDGVMAIAEQRPGVVSSDVATFRFLPPLVNDPLILRDEEMTAALAVLYSG